MFNFSNLPKKMKISFAWILRTSALFAHFIQTILTELKINEKLEKNRALKS